MFGFFGFMVFEVVDDFLGVVVVKVDQFVEFLVGQVFVGLLFLFEGVFCGVVVDVDMNCFLVVECFVCGFEIVQDYYVVIGKVGVDK